MPANAAKILRRPALISECLGFFLPLHGFEPISRFDRPRLLTPAVIKVAALVVCWSRFPFRNSFARGLLRIANFESGASADRLMRRRLQKFLPIFLIALTVQILAPIAAGWTAALAAADPLGAAAICHSDPAGLPTSGDQGADHRAHDGLCSICCAAQAGVSLDTPQPLAAAIPFRQPARVVWRDSAPELASARAGSNAQARAPPHLT